MRSRVRLLPGLAASVVLSLAISLPAQQPTFRSGARSVPAYVTVTDGNNRLITDLTRDDFEMLDNGRDTLGNFASLYTKRVLTQKRSLIHMG